jgi:hypothetical protein
MTTTLSLHHELIDGNSQADQSETHHFFSPRDDERQLEAHQSETHHSSSPRDNGLQLTGGPIRNTSFFFTSR